MQNLDNDGIDLEQARQLVWGLVFHNWNSNDKTAAPSKNHQTRDYSLVKVPVGHLVNDTPPEMARDERRVDAPVYIRPKNIAVSHTVEFPKVDLRGFQLPDGTDILYTPEYLSDVNRARNECVMNMDEAELRRPSSGAKVASSHGLLAARASATLTSTPETKLNLSCHGIKRISHLSSSLTFVRTIVTEGKMI